MVAAPGWRLLTAVLALAAGACGPTTINVAPPAGSPKFLSLPFSDPGVSHGQGWYYRWGAPVPPVTCPYPGDLPDWKTHCGHDYRKIIRGRGHQTFQVLAAAAGRARRYDTASDAGTYVVVEHDPRTPGGELICTRYLHLNPDLVAVPVGRWTRVKAGQLLGWAGKSGTSVIHLHFDVRIGGCASPHPRVDPYDIAASLIRAGKVPTRDHYPGYAGFAGCGPNSLWVRCPHSDTSGGASPSEVSLRALNKRRVGP
jgi:murein DD-endopeptidase MepM/ murein hydrolase activator NlpD